LKIKLIVILSLFIFTMLFDAQEAKGGNFDVWWPWIKQNIDSCVTNSDSWTNSDFYGLSVGTNNADIPTYETVEDLISAHPYMGIWGMNSDAEVVMLEDILNTEAGLWEMNALGEIILSGNTWDDSFWTTNSSGHIVLRSLP